MLSYYYFILKNIFTLSKGLELLLINLEFSSYNLILIFLMMFIRYMMGLGIVRLMGIYLYKMDHLLCLSLVISSFLIVSHYHYEILHFWEYCQDVLDYQVLQIYFIYNSSVNILDFSFLLIMFWDADFLIVYILLRLKYFIHFW